MPFASLNPASLPFRLARAVAAPLLLCAAALGSLPAHVAQAADNRYNQISLQAQARRVVAHDLMRVTLYSEAQDADPAKLAEQTTRVLNAATNQARQVPGITIQTGSRASHPVYGKDGKRIIAWRERAELHLESSNFAALAALAAQLQGENLHVSRQQFMLSRARRKSHEDSLMKEAIDAFRERAQLATQAFGGKDYRLVSVELDSAGFRPVVLRQRVAAAPMSVSASSSAYQEIEAGTSEVSITAAGVIEISL